MKETLTRSILLSALCLTGGLRAEETPQSPSDLPLPIALDRYQAMIARSMFAPATPPPAPPPSAETPSFAQDLYIDGIARVGGKDFVTISAKDRQTWFSLAEGETYNGITLTSVERSDEVGKSKATLKKGEEFGTIGFDEAVVAGTGGGEGAAPQPPAQQPPMPRPGIVSRPGDAAAGAQPALTRRRRNIQLPQTAGAPVHQRSRVQPISSQPGR